MARKTKEETQTTRQALLDAAEHCFLEKGVFRTTLEHIASRAGHTRGAVYWHFQNKLEVFEAVMERVEMPIFNELEQIASPDNPHPLRALVTFHRNAFAAFETDPHTRNALEIGLLRCEYVEETQPILARQQERAAHARARLESILRQAQQLGQLRADVDVTAGALALHSMIIGYLREWVLDPASVKLQAHGITVLRMLVDGMVAPGYDIDTTAAPPDSGQRKQ